jgi:hypothetical protein
MFALEISGALPMIRYGLEDIVEIKLTLLEAGYLSGMLSREVERRGPETSVLADLVKVTWAALEKAITPETRKNEGKQA